MNSRGLWVLLLALVIPAGLAGQEQSPKSEPAVDAAGEVRPQPGKEGLSRADFERPVSLRGLVPNIAADQRHIWSFPAHIGHSRNWVPVAIVLGVTAGLAALDPHDAPYFRRTSDFQGFTRVFNSRATSLGIIVPPISMYFIGKWRKDSKMTQTALLAGQAFLDSEIVVNLLKEATRRRRPSAVLPQGNFSDTWFENGGAPFRGAGSFPSGHSIAAFSVATVVAHRYRSHRWVPFTAYGLAALVAFSRVPLSAHFFSDVFMGGALGYSISRFVVLRQ